MKLVLMIVLATAAVLVVAGYLADKFIDEVDNWGNHDW